MDMTEPFLPAAGRAPARAHAPAARRKAEIARGVPAAMPMDEAGRLAALDRMRVVQTPREGLFDRIVRLAAAHFDVPVCFVSLVDEDRAWVKAVEGLAVEQFGRSVSFCSHAILDGEALVVPDARQDERFAGNPLVTAEPHVVFYAGHPLTASGGERVGVLALAGFEPRAFSPRERTALATFAEMVSEALRMRVERESHRALIEEYAVTRREQQTDSLTRLWNERALSDLLIRERTRAVRLRSPLTLIELDLDGFRRFNELKGHAAGDDLLREVGRRLKRTLRAYDYLGRVGPDGFRAIVCHTNREEGISTAQRMLRVVAGTAGGADDAELLTASIGLASCHFGAQRHGPAALLHAASEALERARAGGGNRVVGVEVAE